MKWLASTWDGIVEAVDWLVTGWTFDTDGITGVGCELSDIALIIWTTLVCVGCWHSLKFPGAGVL